MKFSIIITFYQNINMLRNCIQSLMVTLSQAADVEIIIVNDNPSINLVREFQDFIAGIPFRVVQMEQNSGHSGACNEGARQSRGANLVFLDCDVIVSSGWLEALEQTAREHDDCGAVAASILDFATNQVVYFGMELYGSETIKPFQGADRRQPYLHQDHCSTIVTSGCMLIARDIFIQVGGFDEVFYNSCNDLDLSMKLNAAGRRNYVAAQSVVYHRGNVSGGIRFTSHLYARSLFFQKWGGHSDPERALSVLETLYRQQAVPPGDYLVMNFSHSLFSGAYLQCLYKAAGVTPLDEYRFHPQASKILLTDYLLWDTCQLEVPFLYFVDDYRDICSNYLWFHSRPGQLDLIADPNGNLMPAPGMGEAQRPVIQKR